MGNERSYSDREFALILDRAAELGASAESPSPGRAGLTLDEIKAIALEAGFEPALIDRAARQLPANPRASAVERSLGGPLKHELTDRFDTRLTEEQSAHLLNIVRAAMDQQGEGDSTAGGMSWNSVGEGRSQIFVTAHREEEGTRVRVVVNRHEALVLTGMLSLTAGMIGSFVAAAVLDLDSGGANVAIFAAGLGGSLATARAFWSSTTERYRRQAGALMDLFARTLDQRSSGQNTEAARIPEPAWTSEQE